MSRAKFQDRKGPKLPFALQQELGLPQSIKKHRTQVADRKRARQEARRGVRTPPRSAQRPNVGRRPDDKEDFQIADDDSEAELSDNDEGFVGGSDDDLQEPEVLMPALSKKTTPSPSLHLRSASLSLSSSPAPSDDGDESDTLSRGSREYSPEIVLDASSRTFKDKQADDDAEILALERKLGMKDKQKSQIFDDGFDDMLNGLEGAVDSKKRKREGKDWLEQKRRRLQSQDSAASGNALESGSAPEDEEEALEEGFFEGFKEDEEVGGETNDDYGRTTTEAAAQSLRIRPTRENPYVAPLPANSSQAAKYTPPSQRKPPETDNAKLDKLRRQAQGSLNKLSEANIISIVDEFDKLYQTNPRQDVNTVLIDLLLAVFSDASALQNTYIILHAAFIAALYKIVGAEFGAEIVSKLVERFDRYYNDSAVTGKVSSNLASLLANLFTFGVVSSALIYDHIRLLLSQFNENSAELLLRIMRDCGPQLRSDDPTALKGIVQTMYEVTARISSDGKPINVRTRVMMDTITDLKNNKVRQATNAAGATGEHLTRMRKALGSLNSRQLRATEALGITRSDILNSDRKGKWWLVGASWKGHQQEVPLTQKSLAKSRTQRTTHNDSDQLDYQTLFNNHKLTSPVHRSIFIAITSAEDATDALARLSKLRLTRKQELEMAPVILRGVRAEQTYNAYYSVLAKMLLREKKYKMSFSIALWKFFSQIGERQNEDSDDEDAGLRDEQDVVQASEMANVARMYAYLIARGFLRLDVLKTLNVGFTKENATLFLEVLFIALLAQNKLDGQQKIAEVFSGVETRQVKAVAYFLRKCVRASELVGSKEERQKVMKGCRMAVAALAALERGGLNDEDE